MNSIHANLISGADILRNDLRGLKDPLDNKVPRGLYQLVGLALTRGLSGVFFLDACADEEKLKKLNAKLISLENMKLDKNSPDYEKALNACIFQKNIYKAMKDYLPTAQKIKLTVGAGLFIAQKQTFLPGFGYLIFPLSLTYGFCNVVAERRKLNDRFNEIIANEALRPVANETSVPLKA